MKDLASQFAQHAVRPFVDVVEGIGGVLGYEVINEGNMHWKGIAPGMAGATGHGLGLAGRTRRRGPIYIGGEMRPRDYREILTGWLLSQGDIQSFVNACLAQIRTAVPGKIVLSGVTNGQLRPEAMRLFYEPGDPTLQVDLSAAALTRYNNQTQWRSSSTTPDLPSQTHLRIHHDKALFIEAGEIVGANSGIGYDCRRHAQLNETIMRRCFEAGYAGVFLWHYDDPERGARHNTHRNQHAFTEYDLSLPPAGSDHDHRGTVVFRGARPRPAAHRVREFVNQQASRLLGQLPGRTP